LLGYSLRSEIILALVGPPLVPATTHHSSRSKVFVGTTVAEHLEISFKDCVLVPGNFQCYGEGRLRDNLVS
jgi:hypothetical protein